MGDLRGSYGTALQDGGEGAKGETFPPLHPSLDLLGRHIPEVRWKRVYSLLKSEACHGPAFERWEPLWVGGNRAPWPLVSRRDPLLLSQVEGTLYHWIQGGHLALLFRVVQGREVEKHSPDLRSSGLSFHRYLLIT